MSSGEVCRNPYSALATIGGVNVFTKFTHAMKSRVGQCSAELGMHVLVRDHFYLHPRHER